MCTVIAFAVFLLAEGINRIKAKKEIPKVLPAPAEYMLLLRETRDFLKKENNFFLKSFLIIRLVASI